MLQRNRRIKVLLNMLLEAGILFVSYRCSVFIRFSLMNGVPNPVNYSVSTSWLIVFYSLCTVALFYLFHLYIPVHRLRLGRELSKLVLLNLIAIVALGSVLYLLRFGDFSRVTLGLFGIISTAALCVKRIIWRVIMRRRYQQGIGVQRVILIGSGKLAEDYLTDIFEHPHYGRRVIGYVGNDVRASLGTYLGSLDAIEEVLESVACEEIVVALEANETDYIQDVLNTAGKEGLRVSMIPFYRRYFPGHPTIETVGHSILIDLRATPLDNLAMAALKRGADILGSAILLLLLSPLMLATAVGVKLGSPGPIFFRQCRVGLNKKEFVMLKFRSMRVNAEENTAWSKSTDPRRTRFGSFIRKYSIDELPQLINVLKGDMSLVGPRPELPYFVYQFKESVPLYLVRQQVRPGMTGWAQVHGLRGDTSIEDRVKYDIWYIENWSPWLDVKILFQTLLGGFINQEETSARQTDEQETVLQK